MATDHSNVRPEDRSTVRPSEDSPFKTPAPTAAENGSLLLHDLRVFHDVARAITTALDRDSIVRAIVAQMETYFRPRSWSLLLLDDDQRRLHYAVLEGIARQPERSLGVPVGQGMAGWVAAHGEPLIVADIEAFANAMGPAEKTGRIFPAELSVLSFKVDSTISMPLRSRGRTSGVLQLYNYRLEVLSDYAMTFLHILADYAAIAIENVQAVERIQELTITDDSTGLFNTRHLHAALQSEFERARRFQTEFSVIFMDLDHFKRVNDEYGHLVGTELLVEVARLIQQATRNVDTVFRYGGDEFVILLPQTSKEAAVEVAHRLRSTLQSTSFLEDRNLQMKVSASFGVSTYPQDGAEPQAVLHAADTMMYSVKKSSRNSIAVA